MQSIRARSIHAFRALLCAFAVIAPGMALAEVSAVGVRMPAWYERGGERKALATGTRLLAGDLVIIGADGRVVLELEGGAQVWTGGDTRLKIWKLGAAEKSPGGDAMRRFGIGLQLMSGGVRFASGFDAGNTGRGVLVQAGDLVAGLWKGHAMMSAEAMSPEVCLLDGQLLVQRASALLTRDEPGACFGPRGTRTITAEQALEAARQMDLQVAAQPQAPARKPEPVQAAKPAKPAAPQQAGGEWKVVIASPQAREEADALAQELRSGGYAVEVASVTVKGRQHYRVQVGGFAERAQAAELAARLEARPGAGRPWVTRD